MGRRTSHRPTRAPSNPRRPPPPGTIRSLRRHVGGLLACSAAYFVASLAIAMVAEGTDLDQLPSRSPLAQAAHRVSRLLWAPHDALGHALGPDALRIPGVIPGVLVANTLAWGLVLYVGVAMVRACRARR